MREVLKAQLLLLNQLDHQLAELTGQPPPKQVPRRSFIGKRSLLGPCHEAFCEERRRTRQVLNRNGIWRSSIFPTLEEAETYDRQQAQKKSTEAGGAKGQADGTDEALARGTPGGRENSLRPAWGSLE